MKKILCHHGSPGSPDDFVHLQKEIKTATLLFDNRYFDKQPTKDFSCFIQLGYSFGAKKALEEAVRNPSTMLVILISPFLFLEKTNNTFITKLFQNTFLQKIILPLLAEKKIKRMLETSSFPNPIPMTYQKDAKKYLKGEILYQSLLEKKNVTVEIIEYIKKLHERNTPILVISGAEDKTFNIAPILFHKNLTHKIIPNKGHALLWTETQELGNFIECALKDIYPLGYFPGSHPQNNVASFLEEHLRNFPQRKILTWASPQSIKESALSHHSLTVSQLQYYVSILASEFLKLEINFGDRVILFLPMSFHMYASMFALQKIGAIPTFLDSWARRDQMGMSAKISKAKAMISSDKAFMYLNDLPEIASIKIKIVSGEIISEQKYSAHLEKLLEGKTLSLIAPVEQAHTALITFTTGSSGPPKGADRSHRFLAAQHYALKRHLPYAYDDKDLPVFPIFSLNNLASGIETVIPAVDLGMPSKEDVFILYSQLKSYNITCTTLSPSLFNALSHLCLSRNLNLHFLKRVITGGAPISRDDVKKMKEVAPQAEILILYGSTEVEPMAHITAEQMLSDPENPDAEITDIGVNVGTIDEGLFYKFIKINKENICITKKSDWKDIEVASDEIGELIVAGEHVCEKYFNNNDAFFRAKIKDENNIVWHRTGDLGKLDSNQNLWVVGRVHNAIRRNEQYYFPVRAEIVLKKLPFVRQAAFLGIPDLKLNEKTYVIFSSNDTNLDFSFAKKEITRIMEKNQFVIDKIIQLENIPMDPRHHSKVEYEVLRKQIMSRQND